MDKQIRTRFAPSPTGYLHIGGLRTALYSFLIARKNKGKFILRIENTDQERLVEDAAEVIYKNLKWAGFEYDEGPDIGGDYGPYVQSERLDIYKKYSRELVDAEKVYYCFCSKERLKELREIQEAKKEPTRYDGACKNLTKEDIEEKLKNNEPYVIRQKMPKEGISSFNDLVFGKVSVKNSELEDQILIKTDGFPTYNFANVIDDHLMEITHVVRGIEFLASTPKFNLIYEAFGWEPPKYAHVSSIMKDAHTKLSKRDGDVSVDDFIKKGYTKEAIINYIVLLGWNPGTEQEIFSLEELIKEFSIEKLHKNPAIFDYKKLNWMNGEYLRKMPFEKFHKFIRPFYFMSSRAEQRGVEGSVLNEKEGEEILVKISRLLHDRVEVPADIPEMMDFISELPDYNIELYTHKKMKTDSETALKVLERTLKLFTEISAWNEENIKNVLYKQCEDMGLKTGQVMWPVRISLA